MGPLNLRVLTSMSNYKCLISPKFRPHGALTFSCNKHLQKRQNKLHLLKLSEKIFISSHPEVFLRKGVLKICSKFTGEHPCQSVIEITLWHGCSPVNLMYILRITFSNNSSRWLPQDLITRMFFVSCSHFIPPENIRKPKVNTSYLYQR